MLTYGDGTFFATSKTEYLDQIPGRDETRICIAVQFDKLPPGLAVVDTGAPYCVLSKQQAIEIDPNYRSSATTSIALTVRGYQELPGVLVRMQVTVCADEGDDITIEGTVFVPEEDIELPNFIGYGGLLERINFAVDPRKNFFLFGVS